MSASTKRGLAIATCRGNAADRYAAAPTQRGGRSLPADAVAYSASPTLFEFGAAATIAGAADSAANSVVFPEELTSRYRVIRLLAQSAEGNVYSVERHADSMALAIKIYRNQVYPDPQVLDCLQRQNTSQLARVIEHGRLESGCAFEVSEFFPHGTLHARMKIGRPVPEPVCRLFVAEILAALKAIHVPDERGFIVMHRDVKPTNIFVRQETPLRLALGDFGIALHAEGSNPVRASRFFTPRYAAPECHEGTITKAVDYWSLGMFLLEAMRGRHPFEALDTAQVREVLSGDWRPDLEAIPSAKWRALLGGLLETRPERRWGAAEVGTWLATHASPGAGLVTNRATPDNPLREDRDPASARDLARTLALRWETAARLLSDNNVHPWLANQVRMLAPGVRLDDLIASSDLSADQRLLRLILRLAPDLPPVWKNWLITENNLAKMCHSACNGDPVFLAAVQDIFEQRPLETYGELGQRKELLQLSTSWQNSVAEFEQAWDIVRRHHGPDAAKPARSVSISRLGLLYREGRPNPGAVPDSRTAKAAAFCYAWWNALISLPPGLSPARQLVLESLEPYCEDQLRHHFRTTYEFSPGERRDAQLVLQWGSMPPVVSFSAVHTPIEFTIAQQRITVGARIRLAWNVSGAIWTYLRTFGRIDSVGEEEFSVGRTEAFTLIAIGTKGISLYRIAGPEIGKPVLAPTVPDIGKDDRCLVPGLIAAPQLKSEAAGIIVDVARLGKCPPLRACSTRIANAPVLHKSPGVDDLARVRAS